MSNSIIFPQLLDHKVITKSIANFPNPQKPQEFECKILIK